MKTDEQLIDEHVGSKRKRKRNSNSPYQKVCSMNLFKTQLAFKRKKKSKSPKTDLVRNEPDIDEQVADDVHIDDIEEHQWVDVPLIGKNLYIMFF